MKRIFWAFPLAVLASYSTIGWAEAKYIYPPSVHECALAAKAEPSVAPPAWPDQGQQTVAGRTAITLEAMQSALNKMGMCNPDVIILRADGLNLDRPVLEQLRQVPGRDGYTSFMPMNNRTSYAVKQVMISVKYVQVQRAPDVAARTESSGITILPQNPSVGGGIETFWAQIEIFPAVFERGEYLIPGEEDTEEPFARDPIDAIKMVLLHEIGHLEAYISQNAKLDRYPVIDTTDPETSADAFASSVARCQP